VLGGDFFQSNLKLGGSPEAKGRLRGGGNKGVTHFGRLEMSEGVREVQKQ